MFNIYFKEMKKIFSLIALVAVFAACQPEKVQTAFSVAGVTATINVSVYNVNTGALYTGQTSVTSTEGTVSGANGSWTVAIEAPQSTGLTKHDVTLTVTGPKLAKAYPYTATVPNVLAGGHADINAIIVVGEDGDAYTYKLVGTSTEKVTTVKLVNSHYPTHSHAGDDWYYNNSEFLLPCDIDYTVLSGSVILESNYFLGFDEALAASYEKIYNTGKKTETKKLSEFVSAYAMWRATATYTVKTTPYTIKAKNVVTGAELTAGTLTVVEYSSTVAVIEEKAYPGADGSYVHGHGTDAHGGKANAGGGIIYSE